MKNEISFGEKWKDDGKKVKSVALKKPERKEKN